MAYTMQRLFRSPMTTVIRHAVLFTVVSLFVLAVFFLGIDFASAQTTAFERFGTASTLPTTNIAIIVARVIRIALSVVGIILVALIVYAGYLWFTAAGRPEPVAKAKKILQQAVIGLIIIFSAYSITSFILDRLLDAAFGSDTSASAEAYTEPLSGSLGGGVIDDHYPMRNATEIPRNTKIFVTFKEAIDPSSIIDGYDDDSASTDLNTDSVLIYRTEEGELDALEPTEVAVSYTDDFEIWVFDPVDYLGSAEEDTNYTVALTTNIATSDGDAAFTGTYSGGYEWTFEVSTEIDLTPPTVTFNIPQQDDEEPRNVTVELTFSEAMDPVAATGTYFDAEGEYFTNIEVVDESDANVEGEFEISNAYKTVSFTTFDACGEDPCGDPIYCLPGDEELTVTAKSASINDDEIPQSLFAIADGLVDAAANSLDGDDDYDPEVEGTACGSSTDAISCLDGDDNDDYVYSFSTTNEIEDTVPHIVSLHPEVLDDEIDQSEPVTAIFNTYLKGATLTTNAVSLWPDPWYEMWFAIRKYDEVTVGEETNPEGCDTTLTGSCLSIEHPTFVANADGGWDYYPVITEGIKSVYQICMYPSLDEDACDGDYTGFDYCCNGSPSSTACTTGSGDELPDNTP